MDAQPVGFLFEPLPDFAGPAVAFLMKAFYNSITLF
jgi:hypothetical protein